MQKSDQKDYEIWSAPFMGEESIGIEFVHGPYKGIIIEISDISDAEDEEGKSFMDNTVGLNVDYHVLKVPENLAGVTGDGEFYEYLESTFYQLITEIVKEELGKINATA